MWEDSKENMACWRWAARGGLTLPTLWLALGHHDDHLKLPVREQPQNNHSRLKSWSEQNGIEDSDPSGPLLWLQAPLAGASLPTVYGSRTLLCPPLLPQAKKRRSGAFAVPTYGIPFLPPRQLFLRNTKTVNRGWGNAALRFFFWE